MDLISWTVINENSGSNLVNILELIVSSILTICIIYQTWKLNKKQQELEKGINKQQLEMQNRQQKIDAYPYKREVYFYVCSVIELCHRFNEMQKEIDLNKLSCEEIVKTLEIFQKQYVPDTSKALWVMQEARHLFSEKSSRIILQIKKNYDDMCASLFLPQSIEKYLGPIELDEKVDEQKRYSLDRAINACNEILQHSKYVYEILPKEFNISFDSNDSIK